MHIQISSTHIIINKISITVTQVCNLFPFQQHVQELKCGLHGGQKVVRRGLKPVGYGVKSPPAGQPIPERHLDLLI